MAGGRAGGQVGRRAGRQGGTQAARAVLEGRNRPPQNSLLCPVQTKTWPQATFTALAEPPASSATVSVALRGMSAHALPPSTARHRPSVPAVVLPTRPLNETEIVAPG
eukprot:COSAG02_NODE_177_length_31154_cov_32.205152_2_plen_108_part_00